MNPFRLDSPRPRIPLEEYRYNEVRFKALTQTHPDAAKQMLDRSQRGLLERYQVYEDLATQVNAELKKLEGLLTTDLAAFNKLMRDENVPAVQAPPKKATQ